MCVRTLYTLLLFEVDKKRVVEVEKKMIEREARDVAVHFT